MAELFTLKPIFPGSTEIDQIYKICAVLGSPLQGDYVKSQFSKGKIPRDQISGGGYWTAGLKLAAELGFKFPSMSGCGLSKLVPQAPDEALFLISQMLNYNPDLRPTAMEALQNEWFNDLWSTSYGRAAFTPPEGAQALQLLGDEVNALNTDSIILKDRAQLPQTVPRPKSSSSFELPFDSSFEALEPVFYSNVVKTSTISNSNHNPSRNTQINRGNFLGLML